MPLFFFLSAYLQGSHELQDSEPYSPKKVVTKIISLVIPYFVFSFVYWASKIVMDGSVNNPVTIADLLGIPIFPLSSLWFLYALIILWGIQAIVFKLRIPYVYIVVGSVIISVLSHHIDFSEVIGLTVIPRVLKNATFYAIGVCFGRSNSKPLKTKFSYSMISFVVFQAIFHFVDVPMLKGIISVCTALTGIWFVVSASTILSNRILTALGKSSLGIYLIHDYLICATVIVFRKFISIDSIIIIMAFVISIVVSYFIYSLIMKNEVLCIVFKPQKFLLRQYRTKKFSERIEL